MQLRLSQVIDSVDELLVLVDKGVIDLSRVVCRPRETDLNNNPDTNHNIFPKAQEILNIFVYYVNHQKGGGYTESDKGADGLEEDGEDPEQGRDKAVGAHIFLQSLHTVGVALLFGGLSVSPLHGPGTGGFPGPGGTATGGVAATFEVGQEMGVHLGGCGKRGRGVRADGDPNSANAEYSRALYCDATNEGPVKGGREET